jgi:hypothetical protein
MIRTVLEQTQDLRLTDLLPRLLLVEARVSRDTGTAGGHMEQAFYSGRTGAGSGTGKRCWHCNQSGHFSEWALPPFGECTLRGEVPGLVAQPAALARTATGTSAFAHSTCPLEVPVSRDTRASTRNSLGSKSSTRRSWLCSRSVRIMAYSSQAARSTQTD